MLGKADLKRVLGFLGLNLDPVKEKTLHSWRVSYWRKPWAILRATWDLGIVYVGISDLNILKNWLGSLLTDKFLGLVPRDLEFVDLEWCPESYTRWFCERLHLASLRTLTSLPNAKKLPLVTVKGPVEIHGAVRLKWVSWPCHSLVPAPLPEEVWKHSGRVCPSNASYPPPEWDLTRALYLTKP